MAKTTTNETKTDCIKISDLSVKELLEYHDAIVLLVNSIEKKTRLYDNSVNLDATYEINHASELNAVRLVLLSELDERVKKLC